MAGWWQERRSKSKAKRAQRDYETAYALWKDQRSGAETLLDLAASIDEVQEQVRASGVSVRLKKGENVVAMIEGGGLVEPRTTAGHYQGGSQGVSIRVMKGVRYRVGSHKGTYVRGPEEQTIIDTGGTIYITDQRTLYTSSSRNREWAWSKLVDTFNTADSTYMSVTNRQKTSGIVYGASSAQMIQQRITLALALYDGEVEHLVADLREQLRESDLSKPTPPLPQST